LPLQIRAEIEEIRKDIFVVVNSEDDSVYGGFGANQGFILLEDSVLAFDSGFSAVQARNLDHAIRAVTDKKLKYLINSHDHSDHVFGNSFFWKKYSARGLTIVSHENCKSRLKSLGTKRLAGYKKIQGLERDLDSVEILGANITYSDLGFRAKVEGTELVFSHPPTGAHTLGDSIMYIPKVGVAFMGDVFWNHFLPNMEDANLEGWISYLEKIDSWTYRKFVPGHGEVSGYDQVQQFTDYLRTVRTKLLQVDNSGSMDRSSFRSCFLTPDSENWKLKLILEYNVDALLVKRSGS
jgi:glyoxylase-like metal-dependent hydrolase (beta-lactamase superfamily II)